MSASCCVLISDSMVGALQLFRLVAYLLCTHAKVGYRRLLSLCLIAGFYVSEQGLFNGVYVVLNHDTGYTVRA